MGGLENAPVVLQVKPMIPGSHKLITMRAKTRATRDVRCDPKFNLLHEVATDPIL